MSGSKGSIFLAFIFFLGNILSAFADLPQPYRFSVIDIHNGLTYNQVNCFFKGSRGYIWIGTAAGLNRYNGYELKVFRHDSKDTASISSNNVTKIFEGPGGRVWIGTDKGFNLYDPKTENFDRRWQAALAGFHLPEAGVEDIFKDDEGNYWFLQTGYGLSKYDPRTKKTVTLKHSPAGLSSNRVSDMGQDSAGNFWVIHRNGMLEKIDGRTLSVIERHDYFYRKGGREALYYELLVDSDDDLWVYIPFHARGVFYYNSEAQSFSHFYEGNATVPLNNDLVTGVVEESRGVIWLGTDHGGINVIRKEDFSVSYIRHNGENKYSLVHNSIYSLYKDNAGIIWVGAYKNGVNYYHKNIIRFQHYQNYASDPESLPYDDVNRFVEDDKGNIWIGTNGGGLLYFNRSTGKFTRYTHDPGDPASISSDIIVSLMIDRNKNLWIGTYLGGLNRFDGKTFTRYRNKPGDPGSLPSDNVWEIFEDSGGRIWVGTVEDGLQVFDPETEKFHVYVAGNGETLHNNYISAIAEDRRGRIWTGGNKGIDVIDKKTGKVIHFSNDPGNPESLASNTVFWILKDSRGDIWIGTEEGLDLFNSEQNNFRHFTREDGLPHNTVLTILEDDRRTLWLSTPNGLSNLQRRYADGKHSVTIKNYDECDGLQGKVFNENAALKLSDGLLIFGGPNGYNIFDPSELGTNNQIPEVTFTDFQLFNKSVATGKKINKRIILPQSISTTDHIILKHYENVFSIEFAAFGFFQPEKSKYKYQLAGFDNEWHVVDHENRRVTYTNLDPGDYTFTVMASNNEGVWNNRGNSIKISVLAPFWKTPEAYFLYALLVGGILYAGRRVMLQRERMKFRIEQERREARQLHQLDVMKIRFFTNVSHELRTPLALIMAPVEKLLKTGGEEHLKHFQMIQRNARRLLNMVNQLLDFRKIEVEGIKLHPTEGNIIKFLEETVLSFSDLSEKENITLSFQANVPELDASFDMDKLEKVLFNLLSNAFKFTPEHGKITVTVTCLDNDSSSDGIKIIEIKVKDTGIGIPDDKQEKIFERFFRHEVPSSMVNQGSGIGLSITREFVRIHGGTISVDSTPGIGSCFTVTIPVREISDVAGQARTEGQEPDQKPVPGRKTAVVLVVEDNEDFRFYLKDCLMASFTILEAKNGKEGWQKALSNMPDLILSDLMMPEMDGIDLCKKVKKDPRTAHIPFVLLTAHRAEEQKLKGLNIGASDYVTKPFNFALLLSRIKNLISQRELLQKVLEKKISVETSRVEITSLDDKLILDAARIVEENMEDPDFSVEALSRELGMSRANLYKKMVALTGQSPVAFIRKIRLQHAAQFLEKSQLTVAEVAYRVGFNSTKYFTKYFKSEFNTLPSMYGAARSSWTKTQE